MNKYFANKTLILVFLFLFSVAISLNTTGVTTAISRRQQKWPPSAPHEALRSAPTLRMDGWQPPKLVDIFWGGLRVCMALKVLLCSGDDESPQHWSVLRAIHTLNSPKNYIRLLGGLSPIHLTCWHRAQGLMWGTRGPFPPAVAVVGYGCVGRCWPLEAYVRSINCRNSKNYLRKYFYSYVDPIHSWHLTRQLNKEDLDLHTLVFSCFLCPIFYGIHSRCVSYENCKRPRMNHTPKHENCFAILISVCNFHVSLQFSYQFAILMFWCIVPTWTFAIFIWVCNFHMNLQFSYQFAILTSLVQHLLRWLCMDSMSLWPWTH